MSTDKNDGFDLYQFDEDTGMYMCQICSNGIQVENLDEHLASCQQNQGHYHDLIDEQQQQQMNQLANLYQYQLEINEEQKEIHQEQQQVQQNDVNEDDWVDEQYSDDDQSDQEQIKLKVCYLCNMTIEYQSKIQLEQHLKHAHQLSSYQINHNMQNYMSQAMTLEQIQQQQFDQDWENQIEKRKIDQSKLSSISEYEYQVAISLCADVKEQNKCSICLSEYENDEQLSILKCKHAFHKSCLHQWLNRIAECPKCKLNVQ